MRAVVEHIHIAHAAGRQMDSLESVLARPGAGLDGDRYARGLGHFSHDRRVSRDITLVESETIEQLQLEHGIALDPGDTRRNITTRGVDLSRLLGRRFFLGDVLCVGTGPCNPCQHLADLLGKPIVRPLVGRGGLRADLLTEGRIHVGDTINVAARADLVIGTTNPEKARQCELALVGLDLDIARLSEVIPNFPIVEERSRHPRQNARDKARAYAALVGMPVLALDFALFFEGVDDELQPGAMVRRLRGSELKFDEDQLVDYYGALVARHGGQLQGNWRVAFALAAGDAVADAEVVVTRTFVARSSGRRRPGYPLASLQVTSDLAYLSDLGDHVMAYPELSQPLRRFVAASLSRR